MEKEDIEYYASHNKTIILKLYMSVATPYLHQN